MSAPTTFENNPVSDSTSAPNTSVLIGDSMLKHIQGWKLGRQAGHRVVVKSFADATTSDMSHYVKPTIAKNPDEILIYVGTNDVGKLQPHTIAQNIVDLASFITSESVFRVVISELITRANYLRATDCKYQKYDDMSEISNFIFFHLKYTYGELFSKIM